MRNLTTELKGDKLIITIDVSAKALKESELSASGKSNVIASTNGNTPVSLPGNKIANLGLNLYQKV